jgi:hypothetical protein
MPLILWNYSLLYPSKILLDCQEGQEYREIDLPNIFL